MQAVIDAIRAEREQLLAPIADKLAKLDELERLVTENGAAPRAAKPEPKAKAKPKPHRAALAAQKAVVPIEPAPATGKGRDGLGARSTQVLDALITSGDWMSVSEIAAAVGGSAQSLRTHMQRLGTRGLVEAHGSTSRRRYRAKRSGVGNARAADARQSLDDRVKATALRARIIDLVKHNQGDLNDDRLAQALDVDRDTVSEHTCVLLDTNRIRLVNGGTYALPARSAT